MPQADWDFRFMELALHIAGWSKDKSRPIAAVVVDEDNIVRQFGYNGFPRRVNDDVTERHARPEKYAWTEHAERNAIFNAARLGISVKGCRMYIPWFPCMECARAIVQSGISKIVAKKPDLDDPQWGDKFRLTQELFDEAGVAVQWYEA